MDWLTFIATMFGSLVKLGWPAAVLGSVWIFRERIEELISFMSVRYKEIAVSFQRVEKEAAELKVLPQPEPPPTPEEDDRFAQFAEISPRAAILDFRAELEDAVIELAKPYLPPSKRSTGGHSLLYMTRLLRSESVVDAPTSALLDDLRAIGNKANHDASAVFTEADALRFRELGNKVMNQLLLLSGLSLLLPNEAIFNKVDDHLGAGVGFCESLYRLEFSIVVLLFIRDGSRPRNGCEGSVPGLLALNYRRGAGRQREALRSYAGIIRESARRCRICGKGHIARNHRGLCVVQAGCSFARRLPHRGRHAKVPCFRTGIHSSKRELPRGRSRRLSA
jgi:hypothetical protein